MNSKRIYLLCLLLCGFGLSGGTQVLFLERLQNQYEVQDHLMILEESESLTFEEIHSEENRNLFQAYRFENLKADKVYWGKLELENQLPAGLGQSEWVLHFPLVLTKIELFAYTHDEQQQYGHTGFFTPVSQRTFFPTSKANVVKISLESGERMIILFRAKSERIGSIPELLPELKTAKYYFSQLKRKKQHNGLFTGFLLMLLIYNLFLFLYAKDKAYIFYTVYLLGIAWYSAYNSGDLADLLKDTIFGQSPIYLHFFKLVIYLVLIAYMAFLRSFLDLARMLPSWDRIFRILSLAALPILLLDGLLGWNSKFNYDIADPLTIGYLLIFIALSFIFIFPLYKTRDRKGYFIIAGILFMDLGIFLTILARVQSVDFSLFFYKIGTILELIAFSLGLAFRQKEMEREKQQADFDLERSRILQEQEKKEALRLKELDKLKSRLYTNITHEFRTPLSVIMGMMENIDGYEKEKELIRHNSENLLQLINQILDLDKLESGTMPVKWIQADILPYISYLTESFQSYAAIYNLQLKVSSEMKSCVMDFDEQKLARILSNLLSNAIKFTPAGGKISLHTSRLENGPHNGLLQIRLQDQGIGIPAEQIPHIFDRFFQSETNHLGQGSGIGLALVKELVHLLQGTIRVESQVNDGSTFILEFPIHKHASLKMEPSLPNPFTKPHLSKLEYNGNITEIKNGEAPILLLIEDNPDVVTYIVSFLTPFYQVKLARNGEMGIEMALEIIPDIIISDVMMPKKNGYEVCDTLKNDERTSHIPIVLLTAKSSQEDRIGGLSRGANAYLMKPFHKEELLLQLQNLLELGKKVQLHYANKETATGIPERDLQLEDVFLAKLRQIVLENINNENFSVNHLCEAADLTHNQLYRKLRSLTNLKPSLFIRSIRLQYAAELLQNSSKNVSEIAYEVGFKDPNYFTRVFTEEFGTPPSLKRKK